MSRWFPSGRVVFTNPKAGYQADQDEAAQHLTVGATYHVLYKDVHAFHSRVQFTEHPGIWFNTVLFRDAKS